MPGLRTLIRTGLARAFGPPPFDPAAHPGDPGLFGPASASARLLAEPAAIVGGLRALLVQVLHPLATAGVADHSRFRDDPLGRLRGTSAWVTTTAFGATADALAAAARVRRLHEKVRGTAPDGRSYRADDPALLAWVSIALTSSFLATDRAYAPSPLDGADADAFVAEQSRAAALLDPRVVLPDPSSEADRIAAFRTGTLPLPLIAQGLLPVDVAGLDTAVASHMPTLAVGDHARDVLRFLRWPRVDRTVRAGYLPLLAAAVATLDPPFARMLGVRLPPLALGAMRAQAGAGLTAFRLAVGTSPAARAAQLRLGA